MFSVLKKSGWVLISLGLCGPLELAIAQDTERDRWLWMETDQAQRNKDQQAQEALDMPFQRSGSQEVLVIKGRRLGVDVKDVRQVELAMLLAINHRQWQDLERFLDLYRGLPAPALHFQRFAEAAWANAQGKNREAEAGFREALALQPGFSRARIELARLLFDERRNIEAEQLFHEVLADPRLPEKVRTNLQEGFLRAIEMRRAWSGSIALGLKHNDNLAQTTASNDCLAYDGFGLGMCLYRRQIPAPMAGSGLSYEASAGRRYDLIGRHGLAVRGMVYGDNYANHSDFNEMTLSLHTGYSYQSRYQTIFLAPLIEYNLYGQHKMYHAWGARVDWTEAVSPRLSINVQAEHKRFSYREGYATNNDGAINSVYLTAYRSVLDRWTLIGGIEWAHKQNDWAVNRYTQRGMRAGFYRPLGQDVTLSLLALFRERKHDGYSALLGGKRHDKTQMYIATLRAPGWQWQGFSPRLTWRHTRTHSSIDWLYSYNKNEISLMLEANF